MDRESFDRLMMEHLSAASRLAVRLCGQPDRAEELVQEAMFRASRAWQSFKGQSKFTTWLFQIVINVFRDQLRTRRTAQEVPQELADSSAMEPEQTLRGRELNELVAQCVSALPPRQREVLVLIVYEEMPPSQVAAVLEISEQNVRTNLHLARQALKKQLAHYLDEDHCGCQRRSI